MFFGAFRGRGFTLAPGPRPASAGAAAPAARRAAAAAAVDVEDPEDAGDADVQEEVEDEQMQADANEADHDHQTIPSPAPSASAQQMCANHMPDLFHNRLPDCFLIAPNKSSLRCMGGPSTVLADTKHMRRGRKSVPCMGITFVRWKARCEMLACRYGLARELSDGTVRSVTSSELKGVQELPRSPSTAVMSPAHSTRSRLKVVTRSPTQSFLGEAYCQS